MSQEARLLEKQCWNCTTLTDEHFCTSCERIQLLDLSTNYFSFFKLPIKFHLNLKELENKFYELSRKFHPDFFSQASEQERRYSTERTSMLNDAYRTLKEPLKRANYLLRLQGFKAIGQETKTPPDLLAEIFELNEQLEELRYAKKSKDNTLFNTLKTQVLDTEKMLKERANELIYNLNSIFSLWDNLPNNSSLEEKKKLLNNISDILSKIKYINNLLENIEEEFDE
ncbi:MAG: Fe-S protein assembly co-chaperone HscB [Acidobacteria bacterium]|nr:Fe-S protein assembly co-chaperone HscB [Acidobacteriota bacterium]